LGACLPTSASRATPVRSQHTRFNVRTVFILEFHSVGFVTFENIRGNAENVVEHTVAVDALGRTLCLQV
jgi:hypothetical protein